MMKDSSIKYGFEYNTNLLFFTETHVIGEKDFFPHSRHSYTSGIPDIKKDRGIRTPSAFKIILLNSVSA